jgi:hypothetical protein
MAFFVLRKALSRFSRLPLSLVRLACLWSSLGLRTLAALCLAWLDALFHKEMDREGNWPSCGENGL